MSDPASGGMSQQQMMYMMALLNQGGGGGGAGAASPMGAMGAGLHPILQALMFNRMMGQQQQPGVANAANAWAQRDATQGAANAANAWAHYNAMNPPGGAGGAGMGMIPGQGAMPGAPMPTPPMPPPAGANAPALAGSSGMGGYLDSGSWTTPPTGGSLTGGMMPWG